MTITDKIKQAVAELAGLRAARPDLDLPDEVLEAASRFAGNRQIEERTRELRAAQEKVRALEAAKVDADAAVTAHEQAYKAHRGSVTASAKALGASRDAVAAKLSTAIVALQELHTAATDHRALTEETAATLRAAGLICRYEDEYSTVDFEDAGAEPRGSALVLGGKWWKPIDPAAVIDVALYGVWRGVAGEFEAVTSRPRRRAREVLDYGGELLAAVKLPEPFVRQLSAEQKAYTESQRAFRELLRGPGPSKAQLEEHRREQELEAARRASQHRMAERQYAHRRYLLVREKGEEYVRGLEEQHFNGEPLGHDAQWWAKQQINEEQAERIAAGQAL
ncbi:hypothetical protein [Pseudonocardia sp. WMMC193]|uniref:hypothetical protein n=1 Tax=Pseudonocardia sp. WMMC193 TaxID=2911965 RepID=UPI001F25FB24|nr:hypothetical protein [Pseudonocardia sp. WMMC193]MCF7548513.1 hypothetical protein [Pseudonocardia sp. WMMC193]